MQDQISLGNLVLIGGGRYDHIQTTQTTFGADDSPPGTEHDSRSDHSATVRAGILYAFDFGLSPYFAYTQSFQPPSTDDVSADILKPTRGSQYEIGLKYKPTGIDALITTSLFKIRQKNVTGNMRPDGSVSQTGEVEVNGIEVQSKASLAAGLDATVDGTYLISKITRSNDGNQGNELEQTPKYTGSAWLNYTQPAGHFAGLGAGVGVRYIGRQQIGNDNSAEIPDYAVFDGVVHYQLGHLSPGSKGWKVALNMQNMFDKRYVASCLGVSYCGYGAERQTTASVSYSWH